MGNEKIAGDLQKVKDKPKMERTRKQKKINAIQTLNKTCKEVFANCGPDIIPTPTDIERLKAVLDNMTEADVGVKPNMPFFKTREAEGLPEITYLHFHDCEKFSIGIFYLPPSGVIPLHNHPGMMVFSKLLFATMHIKSCDWVNDNPHMTTLNVKSSKASEVLSAEVRLAKVKVDADFTAPCNTSILNPADCNMNCFTVLTLCVVLDVLGPLYSNLDGRHCAYYRDYPFNNFSVDGVKVPEEEKEAYVWLEETDKPKGMFVVGAPYRGPKIVI